MKQKCKNHPDRLALNLCHSCRSYFCSDCLTEGRDYYYCKDEACQRASKEDLEQSVEKSNSSGFIRRFFQKRNLTVGWYCFWRSSLLTIVISFVFFTIFYLAFSVITPFFLKGKNFGQQLDLAARLNSIYYNFLAGIILLVIPTFSYNWIARKALKKYHGVTTTTKFSCLKVYPFTALLQTISFGLFLPFVIHIIGFTVNKIGDSHKDENR